MGVGKGVSKEGTPKTSFGHCRNQFRKGGHPQIGQCPKERVSFPGIPSLILHEHCFSMLNEQSSKSSFKYLGLEAT